MGWVRCHKRFGVQLALAALALQIALSFGHVHLHGIGGASHHAVAATHKSVTAQPSRQNVPQNTSDNDYCAICASIYLVATSFVPAPPVLPPPVEFERIEHSFANAGAIIAPRLVAFQSRAPPSV